MEGVIVYDYVPKCHVAFGRGDFITFAEITISTIEIPERLFQTFPHISLPEKLTWKSHRSQNKTFIRGASPGIPYELWDKHTIGWRRWNIATQDMKFCDMEVEIVTFVIKGNAPLISFVFPCLRIDIVLSVLSRIILIYTTTNLGKFWNIAPFGKPIHYMYPLHLNLYYYNEGSSVLVLQWRLEFLSFLNDENVVIYFWCGEMI